MTFAQQPGGIMDVLDKVTHGDRVEPAVGMPPARQSAEMDFEPKIPRAFDRRRIGVDTLHLPSQIRHTPEERSVSGAHVDQASAGQGREVHDGEIGIGPPSGVERKDPAQSPVDDGRLGIGVAEPYGMIARHDLTVPPTRPRVPARGGLPVGVVVLVREKQVVLERGRVQPKEPTLAIMTSGDGPFPGGSEEPVPKPVVERDPPLPAGVAGGRSPRSDFSL
jgi:hypothetical protein